MFFSNKGNIDILEALDNIDLFINNKINSLPEITGTCTGFNEQIKNKIEKINNSLKLKNEEELKVFGEIMLISEKLADGNIDDEIHHVETSNEKLNYISNTYNTLVENLRVIIETILQTLKDYSNHNYVKKIEMPHLQGEFKMLVDGVNDLRKTITTMLIENKSNGLTLDIKSEILLENIDKLNKSSNQTAASLEESAAALEEITSNIRNTTDKISKMTELSKELILVSNNGEALANKTTIAMEEINTEVNSINEAITVIDQIAFQTNILSLNAAVEAATAGEAGKGFAVVAQEVRNLANRSADAAKEIKKIVENATLKANNGKNIANNMIEGYKELSENISSTTSIINDIQNASKEQLLGIEQINDSINLLDRQTQLNATIANESYEATLVTDKISKLIVANANEKAFVGKDSVHPKDNL
ncbi:methyl-accepting chemotaxis protein [Arcobacter sp. L]|jgi:methyl-accepting chemotaxis protein|uniref:methyl-accepting chemotaxis protein n=1 Tax=unclassified Arcobacter TaxID=2593671 RepID=UPI0002295A77|nr:methyl-accepting chemotaxis protein [Arcobacter sp. L]